MYWEDIKTYLQTPGVKITATTLQKGEYVIGSYNEGYILKSQNGDIMDYHPSISEQFSDIWYLSN